jgi:hypoxanthine-DNA glycosylase
MQIAFPPIIDSKSRLLVLGSMPGEASLAAGECYAFGRNAFWKIMGELLEIPPDAKYQNKVKALQENRIALWDVIESCERVGSLDSKIDHSTVVANDFCSFLKAYPRIKRIFFNGKSVRAMFDRHVQGKPTLPDYLKLTTLPSTSPANARLRFDKKLEAWKLVLG